MTTVTSTATVGSKRLGGGRTIQADGPRADVTISFDNTKVKTKGDLHEACMAIINRLSSDQLK